MATNPYALLKEVVSPMIEQIPEEMKVSDDPLLKILGREVVTGIQTPEAGILELYQFKAAPRIIVNDRWVYGTGTRDMDQGRIKLKKFTVQLKVTEDELDRIEQNGMDASIIARNIRNQKRDNGAYLINQIQRWGVNRWEGATDDLEYDDQFNSMFQGSNTGTISEPSDMNATAGTPQNLSAAVSIWGTNKTANNVQRITQYALTGLTFLDFVSKLQVPVRKIYMGCHPKVAALFRTTRELLNSTTGQVSNDSLAQLFEASGITIVESVWFDSDASTTVEDATTQLTFFADPEFNFKMIVVPPPKNGEAWSDWKDGKEINKMADLETITYEKHKKMEIGFLAQPYWVRTAAATDAFYKPLYRVTITLYNNA